MRTSTLAPIAALPLVALTLALAGCAGSDGGAVEWRLPRVVQIETSAPVTSLFPSWGMWIAGIDTATSTGLMLREGDYILSMEPDDAPLVVYRESDGLTLRLAFTKWSATLAGKVVGLSLKEDSAVAWLGKAADQELVAVRLIGLPDSLDATGMAAVRRLATANPGVGIFAESPAALTTTLSLFRPVSLLIGEGDAKGLDLTNQPQLHTLFVKADQAGTLNVLRSLPNLSRLVLIEWDVARAGPLPPTLTRLTSLYVIGGEGAPSISALGTIPQGIEELSLLGMKGLEDVSAVTNFSGLRMLSLGASDEVSAVPPLSALKNLEWVGLPPAITQEQFAAFVAAHPKIGFLEMVKTKNVTDLAPLRTFADLRALVLMEYGGDLSVVKTLKSLKYLGVMSRKEAPAEVAELRAALPDAVVVAVRPFCLGSGWILLLMPLAALPWFFGTRARRDFSLPVHGG